MATANQSRSKKTQKDQLKPAVAKTSSKSPAPAASKAKKPSKTTKTAAKPTTKPKSAKGRGGGKVDWEAAKRWYMDDARRSYADVAKQFGCVKKSVEDKSARDKKESGESWAETRQKTGEAATEQFQTEKQKELAKTDERHLDLYKSIQNAGASALYRINESNKNAADKAKNSKKPAQIDAGGLRAAALTVKAGIEGERVILGLPILISRAETAITDYTPPTIADAEKALDKLQARKDRLRELRNKRAANS